MGNILGLSSTDGLIRYPLTSYALNTVSEGFVRRSAYSHSATVGARRNFQSHGPVISPPSSGELRECMKLKKPAYYT